MTAPITDIREVQRFKIFVKENYSSKHNAVIILALNTGLKPIDLVNLTWQNALNPSGKIEDYILYMTEYSETVKKIPLNKECKEILKELRAEEPNSFWIFQSRKFKGKISHWHVNQISNFMRSAGKEAGVKQPVSAHTLRKTFGYHAYMQGVDMLILQRLFNHASLKLTYKYLGIPWDNIDTIQFKISI